MTVAIFHKFASQVSTVLSGMVSKLLENPSVRLLKHIVRCYLRLSEHTRARDALRQCLPEALRDQSFAQVLRSEDSVQRWLAHLLKNLSERLPSEAGATVSPLIAPSVGSTAARAGLPQIPALPSLSTGMGQSGGLPQQQPQQQSAWNM